MRPSDTGRLICATPACQKAAIRADAVLASRGSSGAARALAKDVQTLITTIRDIAEGRLDD